MKSKNVKYWIWLSKALGFGSTKIKALYELYRDISVFCDGGEKEWRFSGLCTDTELRHLSNIKQDAADGIISRCDELGYSILPIDDDAYPKCLRAIPNPPAVLYVWGSLPDVDKSDTIGIVGTRTASNYGLKNSYSFGYALAKYEFIVVSGGALGVDCASHRGVLAANGVTVCVRGCGINYPYLMDNAAMREAITQKGAVASRTLKHCSVFLEERLAVFIVRGNVCCMVLSSEYCIIAAVVPILITCSYRAEKPFEIFQMFL